MSDCGCFLCYYHNYCFVIPGLLLPDADACLKPILQGYQGMVDGADHIIPAEWKTVSNIIQRVCIVIILIAY